MRLDLKYALRQDPTWMGVSLLRSVQLSQTNNEGNIYL